MQILFYFRKYCINLQLKISYKQYGNKGKTSGSRALFVKGENTYAVHKPHPGNIVKGYVLKQVYEYLKKLDLLK